MVIDIFVFVVGLCIGSFIACQYDRVRDGWSVKDILLKPSQCLACGTTLKWWNNVPLISFCVQKGRCSTCGTTISWRLPLIEFLTGVAFVIVWKSIEILF